MPCNSFKLVVSKYVPLFVLWAARTLILCSLLFLLWNEEQIPCFRLLERKGFRARSFPFGQFLWLEILNGGKSLVLLFLCRSTDWNVVHVG